MITADNSNAVKGEKKRNNKSNKKCYNCQKGLFFEKLPKTLKKLVLVLTTSMLETDYGENVVRISYIYYLI